MNEAKIKSIVGELIELLKSKDITIEEARVVGSQFYKDLLEQLYEFEKTMLFT